MPEWDKIMLYVTPSSPLEAKRNLLKATQFEDGSLMPLSTKHAVALLYLVSNSHGELASCAWDDLDRFSLKEDWKYIPWHQIKWSFLGYFINCPNKRWYAPGGVAVDLEKIEAYYQDDIEAFVQEYPQVKYFASIICSFQKELISQWGIFYEIYFLSMDHCFDATLEVPWFDAPDDIADHIDARAWKMVIDQFGFQNVPDPTASAAAFADILSKLPTVEAFKASMRKVDRTTSNGSVCQGLANTTADASARVSRQKSYHTPPQPHTYANSPQQQDMTGEKSPKRVTFAAGTKNAATNSQSAKRVKLSRTIRGQL